jgi:hypothetical protein
MMEESNYAEAHFLDSETAEKEVGGLEVGTLFFKMS